MRSSLQVTAAVLATALLFPHNRLPAQRRADVQVALGRSTGTAPGSPRVQMPSAETPLPSTGGMIVGGLLAAAALGTAGGYAGYGLSQGCQEFMCDVGPIVVGALVGSAIGLPIGVHAVGGKGRLGQEIGASLGLAVVGALLAPVTMGISALAILPVQMLVSIGFEREADRGASTAP